MVLNLKVYGVGPGSREWQFGSQHRRHVTGKSVLAAGGTWVLDGVPIVLTVPSLERIQ